MNTQTHLRAVDGRRATLKMGHGKLALIVLALALARLAAASEAGRRALSVEGK